MPTGACKESTLDEMARHELIVIVIVRHDMCQTDMCHDEQFSPVRIMVNGGRKSNAAGRADI